MKKISTVLLATILLLSGCSKQEPPNELSNSSSSTSSITDPMKEPVDNSDTEGEILYSTQYGVYFSNDSVSLSGNELIVSPVLSGGQSGTRVGIMVFVDGVIQKYQADDYSEEEYMSVFDIEPKSEVKYNLNVSARIDGGLDEHYISMITMLAPEYVSSADSPHFGNYHKTLSPETVIAPDSIEGAIPAKSYQVLKAENSVFTQKQIEKYGIENGDESGRTQGFLLLQGNNRIEDYYTLTDGESKLTLHFTAFTTLNIVENQRVTFFVNHKPVTFNGGYEHLDYTLEGEKITEIDIELDDLRAGDFVYFISVPLVATGYEYINKSASKLIISGDDISHDGPGESSGSQVTQPTSSTSNSSSTPTGSSTDQNSTSNSSSIPMESSSVQGSGAPNNPLSPSISTTPKGESSVKFANRVIPMFSIDGNVYVLEAGESIVIYKLDNSGNVLKKTYSGSSYGIHGDKITIINESSGSQTINLVLLDKEFNEIKSVEFNNSNCFNIDFDDKTIAYTYRNDDSSMEIRVCDWSLKSTKTLMKVPRETIINDIALADGFVAFKQTNKSGTYYGICNFSGQNEKYLKADMSNKVQVYGNTVLWANMHGGDTSKGEITVYRNGKFEIIRPLDPFESQDVFLTGENEFFTWLRKADVVRQYKDGVMIAEIPLEKGEFVHSIVRAGNKVFAGTAVFIETDVENEYKTEYQLKFWELS